MAKDGGHNNLLASQMALLSRASDSITRAMAVVPESQLAAAIHRGFRIWPYTAPPASAFLVPVLQTIVDQVREAVCAEVAALGVGRFPNEPFNPWVVSGVSEELRTRMGVPCPVGTLGLVAVKGGKIRIKDIRTHPDFKGYPPGHPEIKSLMALPIQLDSMSLGNLYIGNKIGQEEFSEEDERLVEVLARLAGSAIQQTYIQCTVAVQQSQVQALLDSVPSGVIFVDKSTGSITANNAAMELFECPLTEASGRDQYRHRLLNEKGTEFDLAELPSSKALEGKTVLGQEMLVMRTDGTSIPVRANAAPVIGSYREVMGAVVVFENISLQKKLEAIRQQMAAMIVHDIRNPIQAVLMNAQAIRNSLNVDTTVARHSKLIEESVSRVISLTDRLLEVARIESAQIKLDLKTVELREFLKAVIARASGAYPDRRIEVKIPPESLMAKLDLERMEQVLTNLIDNAAKYSPKDTGIEVTLSAVTSGFDILVRDHGPGLEPEILAHLFEPYKRGMAGKSASAGGLGLGLFIVKGFVEAHGGTVMVENRGPGEGSIFRLHFPHTLCEQVAAA